MTAESLRGEVLLSGSAEGPVLKLERPISFWGGVDPDSGRISDPRHPQHGQTVGGRVLVLPATIGSSSGSAVMLELIAGGLAPAALILGRPDAILVLGVVVAKEMGHAGLPPVLLLPPEAQSALITGQACRIGPQGAIALGARSGSSG